MKKIFKKAVCAAILAGVLTGCGTEHPTAADTPKVPVSGTRIALSDSGITVNEKAVSSDSSQGVYTANDIIYYEAGHDFTYGEGSEDDAHTQEDAATYEVVHIQEPGTYILSGTLSRGQIAVDLGEDAEADPDAVVTLVLDGVDISCDVAPAVIFYNVYECGSKDGESATRDVDTSKAGANVIIADGSENTVNGAYVARIYKPDSVVLSEDGSEVLEAKKLHKYDGAFYSKMSMNVYGGEKGDGVLNINAANEGLDSELHLTIHGGNINIVSGNDGINTNEDGISVTTISGGNVNILVDGSTGEGDGIDSNGWLVINGGAVRAQACAFSGDAGIDSDMGIHINGGTVFAVGNMLDQISESQQNYGVFQFANTQKGGLVCLKNQAGEPVLQQQITNDFSYLILSCQDLQAGEYTLWVDDVQMEGTSGQQMGFMGGQVGGAMPPEDRQIPEGMEAPSEMVPPEKPEQGDIPRNETGEQMPERMQPPEGMEMPEDGRIPGQMGKPGGQGQPFMEGSLSELFFIRDGGNYFQGVTPKE